MHRNIVSLTKAMSFWWLTPLNCSALIPSILQAVQIQYMMYSPLSFRNQKEHFFVPVVCASHISKLRSGSDLFIGGRDWNVLFIDLIENPTAPPVDRDVGTVESATFARLLDHICLVVGKYLPHFEKHDANESREV